MIEDLQIVDEIIQAERKPSNTLRNIAELLSANYSYKYSGKTEHSRHELTACDATCKDTN